MEFKVTKKFEDKELTAVAQVDVPTDLDGLCEKYGEEKITQFALRAVRAAIFNKMAGILVSKGDVKAAVKAGVEWEPATRMTPIEKAIKQIKSLGLPAAAEKQALAALEMTE